MKCRTGVSEGSPEILHAAVRKHPGRPHGNPHSECRQTRGGESEPLSRPRFHMCHRITSAMAQ